MKNVAVEIGSLSVDGVTGGRRNGAAVARGIESALGRMLAQRGVSNDLAARNLANLTLPDLRLPAHATDAQIGDAVAMALSRLLGGRR